MIRAIELIAMRIMATYGNKRGPGSKSLAGCLMDWLANKKNAHPNRPTIPVLVSLRIFIVRNPLSFLSSIPEFLGYLNYWYPKIYRNALKRCFRIYVLVTQTYSEY